MLKTVSLLLHDISGTIMPLFNFLPPQRHHIGDRSLSLCNMFLDEMAKQARNLITDICTEQCTLSDQVRTHRGSPFKGTVGHMRSFFSVMCFLPLSSLYVRIQRLVSLTPI